MGALGSLVVRIIGDNTQFNKSIAATQAQLNKSTKGLQTIAKSMTSVGDSMTKSVTVPIVAVGAALLKVGTEFDDAYDKIRINTGKTGDEFKSLQEDFKAVAKDSASSFDDISTAISELNTRLGLSGEPLQDMAKQMTNLARITKTDINTLIPFTTRVFGDWAIATEKQSESLDYMFKVSQNTGIGVDQLSEKVVYFGASLRQMGFDFETSAALIGKFEKEGVNAEVVLSSLRIALGRMADEGVTDTNEALNILIERIKNAGSTGEANSIAMETFGKKAGVDMASAIREGRFELDDLVESLNNSKDSINAAAAATNDWKEKLQKELHNAMVSLEPLANKVFDSVGRAADGTIPKIENLTSWFGNLDSGMQDGLLTWALLLAAIGPVLSILGRTTTGVIQLRNALLTMNASVTSFAATGSIMAKMLTGLASGLAQFGDKGVPAFSAFLEDMGLLKTASGDLQHIVNAMKGVNFANMLNASEAGNQTKELANRIQNIAQILSKSAPEIQSKAMALHAEWQNGNLTLAQYADKLADLIAIQNDTSDSTEKAKLIIEEKTKVLEEEGYTTEKATEQANEYAKSLGYATDETDNLGESTDETTQSVDDLIASLYQLYNLNQSVTEATWNYEDSLKNLTDVINNANSTEREKQEAIFGSQDALESLQIAMAKEYQDTETTIEKKKELQNEYIKTGIEAVNMGTMSETAFWNMANTFGVTKDNIISHADEIGIKLEGLGQIKVNPQVGLDTSDFDTKIARVNTVLSGVSATIAYISSRGFSSGGLVGFSQGALIDKIVSASKGINLPKFDNGGMLAVLHPPEVVLNGKEALQLVWNMATKPMQSEKSSNIVQNIYPQTSIDLTDQSNIRIIKQAVAEVFNK